MSLLKAKRDTDWIGCIDFGTALSKVAMVKRKPRSRLTDSDIVPLPIGAREGVAVRNPLLLPSLVFVTDDGRLLFGDEAQPHADRAEWTEREAFVSPKQYLSTDEFRVLDERLDPSIDPSREFSPRGLLTLFLAHLLVQAGQAAARAGVPWPVPLRIARPAWEKKRAAIGEETLRSLVLHALAIVDALGSKLAAVGGLPRGEALSALSKAMNDRSLRDPFAFPKVFELNREGSASVLEATAVAAGSIRETGRRVVAVADIGGGTSDFGAFMTGLSNRDVLGEIKGSSYILREAGDHLDMLLTRHIMDKAGIDPHAPAGRGAARRLRSRQRANKEALFRDGVLRVQLGDDVQTVTVAAFLADPRVQSFVDKLRKAFHGALAAAVECARRHPQPQNGGATPVEILLTGGGHGLPMVRLLASDPSVEWAYLDAAPELPEQMSDDMKAVRRQLAVAIGGAVKDLPRTTVPVRL
jgi:molecular chaperone DnaK (HSP70)